MDFRILCVDDDDLILQAYQRQFRKRFQIETAVGPAEGLRAVRERGPYAVVVADMRMPEMDGMQFLALVRECDPNTTRIVLSGNADPRVPAEALKRGQVFRFLTKPCPRQMFTEALEDAIEHYRSAVEGGGDGMTG